MSAPCIACSGLVDGLLYAATLPRDLRRWPRPAAGGAPRVFYGFDRLPGPQEFGSGGIIKAQDLQTRFPNTPRGANVLYLISSSLPQFAPRLARLARRAGVKVVLNQNGVGYPGWLPVGWREHNRPMRQVLELADHVVYQSRFCRETADRFLAPFHGNSEVLLNPVDTTVFSPAPADPAPGRFVILLAGSHHFEYRVRVALEAFALLRRHLPEARLLVAGRYVWQSDPAAALAEARGLAARLGIGEAVEFEGPYRQTEAATLLRRAHVLLHTKYADPCPRLAAEALACGLPVVYSASGGLPELVGDAAGIGLPAPCDYEQDHAPEPEALAEALQTVAAQWPAFSTAARRRALAALDVQPWLQRHAELFQRLVNGTEAP